MLARLTALASLDLFSPEAEFSLAANFDRQPLFSLRLNARGQMSSYDRMSSEERRAYNRAAQWRSRARTAGAADAPPRMKGGPQGPRDKIDNSGDVLSAGAPSARPTPAMIEAAQRRLLANRTITASLMGDPPPGHSALDHRAQTN